MEGYIELTTQEGNEVFIKANKVGFVSEETGYGNHVKSCVLVDGVKVFVKNVHTDVLTKLEVAGYW